MNYSPCRASSGRSTDSSKGSYTGSSKVSDMACRSGNIGTSMYMDSCSIGTDKEMSMNIAMDMNIHNPVRNLDQQPMRCKAPKGQVVPYLV
jgi:hypothetical protein